MLDSTSDVPIVSRMLCIDQQEMPMSTVRMPVSAAMAGPIVEPAPGQPTLSHLTPVHKHKAIYSDSFCKQMR